MDHLIWNKNFAPLHSSLHTMTATTNKIIFVFRCCHYVNPTICCSDTYFFCCHCHRNRLNDTFNDNTKVTRWYPWGIQSPHTSTATGGGVFWVSSDLNSGKKVRVFHFQGGGVFWVRLDLNSRNNFNFRGGGGECSGTKFQNRGVLENLVKNFWKPSWLVYHR